MCRLRNTEYSLPNRPHTGPYTSSTLPWQKIVFLSRRPRAQALCLFHAPLAEDRFLVMPPAGDFPAGESHQSPPGLRPRTPLSRAAVGFRQAANLHPTAASVRPCAHCWCLPRLISSQSPKASAIAWCPLIAATGCCARFRTALPWQRFLPGTPAEQNQLPQQRGSGYCMAARAALSQVAPPRRWLSGPCKEISRGRGLQRAESSTEARWAEGLQARQRGTAAGQNGARGRSPGGLWELSPGGKFPAGGRTRRRSFAVEAREVEIPSCKLKGNLRICHGFVLSSRERHGTMKRNKRIRKSTRIQEEAT